MKSLCMVVGLLVVASAARADMVDITFSGAGVSGSLHLTYGPTTDMKYPDAFEVTGISGTFSDSTLGIVDAKVLSLEAITHDTPEPGNTLAPDDFSRFAVASGLAHGSLSFDNLFWPGGSPQTANSYMVSGGFLDIYGLLFHIDGGPLVNLWSNGDFSGTGHGPIDYGVAVVTPAAALHYVEGGVTAQVVPEPGTLAPLGIGLAGALAWRRRLA